MKKSLFLSLSLSALMAFSAQAYSASTSFNDPSTASWGNWDRGDTGTAYAHWETIDSLSDHSPDAGNAGNNVAGLITNNLGGFITGSGLGGNVYSFSDTPNFTTYLQTAATIAGPATVALQLATAGTALDLATVVLAGFGIADSVTTLASGAAGGPFGGDATETLFVWELATGITDYVFNFLATGAHLSLDAVSIDVGPAAFTQPPSAVPIPAAIWLLGPVLAGLGITRRKTSVKV